MNAREYEALKDALASTRMEGFIMTEQMEKDCIRLMTGEISISELVNEIINRSAEMAHISQENFGRQK